MYLSVKCAFFCFVCALFFCFVCVNIGALAMLLIQIWFGCNKLNYACFNLYRFFLLLFNFDFLLRCFGQKIEIINFIVFLVSEELTQTDTRTGRQNCNL